MYTLNLNFYQLEPLLNEAFLNRLQRILIEIFPNWSSKLYLKRTPNTLPINIENPSSLYNIVNTLIDEHGELYYKLVSQYGKPKFERRSGIFEIRGRSNKLIFILRIDEMPIAPLGSEYRMYNTLTFQICNRTVERKKAADLAQILFKKICSEFPIIYAFGAMNEEFEQSNMDLTNGVRAIGRDISKYLPGIYWINYFGQIYVDLFGANVLKNIDTQKTFKLDSGYIVCLTDSPESYDSEDYLRIKTKILNTIGTKFFFDRRNIERKTLAPQFDLTKFNK